MKEIVDLNRLDDIRTFSPSGHTLTTDRKLIDRSRGARNFELWHGEIEPGGTAELHTHENMEQAFIVLEGEGMFTVGAEAHRLGRGSLIFVPARRPHAIASVGASPLKMLIVLAPPPDSGQSEHNTKAK